MKTKNVTVCSLEEATQNVELFDYMSNNQINDVADFFTDTEADKLQLDGNIILFVRVETAQSIIAIYLDSNYTAVETQVIEILTRFFSPDFTDFFEERISVWEEFKDNCIAFRDGKGSIYKIWKYRVEKSFVDYFFESQNINTEGVKCIRTYGWGEKSVLRVEYADFHKDYKPVGLAKKYLKEVYGYCPENLNFNNAHYDRIGCSVLNVYDTAKAEYDEFSKLPTVVYAKYNEQENWGSMEFAIHNNRQMELSYAGRLYEYFQ
jgi:hypothetical protein